MPDPAGRALLDAAPGPLHPRALETLLAAIDAGWADPRRLYREARTARQLLDQAREVIAAGLDTAPETLSFAPSGPDALRAALGGCAHAGRRRGGRWVATAVEHSAVLLVGRHLAARGGDEGLFEEVGVDAMGRVDLEALARALAVHGTVCAAVQHANLEVGTRQPLAQAHELARREAVPLVVDAMASLGRDPVPVDGDVLVGEATSWGGPGGLGLLVVRPGARWASPGPRSEVEHGRLPTAPWVPLALAAAEAWQQTASDLASDAAEARELVDRIRTAGAQITDMDVVGDPEDRLPHIVTMSALYADGEALVTELDRRGVAVASGSACTASTVEPSHVLAAMGALTHGNIRVTLPLRSVAPRRGQDVALLLQELPAAVAAVRAQLGASDL